MPVPGGNGRWHPRRDATVKEWLVVSGNQCSGRHHDDQDTERTADQDRSCSPHPADAVDPDKPKDAPTPTLTSRPTIPDMPRFDRRTFWPAAGYSGLPAVSIL